MMNAARPILDYLFDDIQAAHTNFDRDGYTIRLEAQQVLPVSEFSDFLTTWITMVYSFLGEAVKLEVGEEWAEELTFPDLLMIHSNGFLDFFSARIYSTSVVHRKIEHCWDIVDAIKPSYTDISFTSAKAPNRSLFSRALNDLDSLISRIKVLDYARLADCHLEAYCLSGSSGYEDMLHGSKIEWQVDLVQDALDRNPAGITHGVRKVLEKFLYKTAKTYGILPKCFYLDDVKKMGAHPIGIGSFGDVYKGREGERVVAVKCCRFFWQPETYREVCREAFIWKPLEHPNILPFLGICVNGFPSVGLVSPFMENGNLTRYMKRRTSIDKRDIAKQICLGLEYLHTRQPKVIHGDLKCANILVDDTGIPKIADFGLARVINIATLTSSTRNSGTLRWQAPELVHPGSYCGDGRVNTKTDMYAFGMTCLELYKEEIPFVQKTDWEVIAMARDGVSLEFALEVTKECFWVSSILEQCCCTKPASRLRPTDILDQLRKS